MKTIRKATTGLALGAALTAAWVVGGKFVGDVKFARAEAQVDATRQQIASGQDLAWVYKAVGKAVEPSVVQIDVKKTMKNPLRGGRNNDDLLRRFFPDRDGDGQPDVPDGLQIPDPNDNGGGPDQFEQQ